MDGETIVSLFSLTKAMTASAIGVLLEEDGALGWDTTLKSVLPDFRHLNAAVEKDATLRELLTHRAGLSEYNSLWMQDSGRFYFDKSQTLPAFAALPVTAGIRQKYQYNNSNYAMLAAAVEKATGLTPGSFLVQKFFDPLKLTTKSVVRPDGGGDNLSEGFMALSHGSHLLTFYNSLLHAAADQFSGGTTTKDSPSKQIPSILSGYIPTGYPILLDQSYGFGWHRSQLTNSAGASGENKRLVFPMPTIACALSWRQFRYVAKLANCDAFNWMAGLLLEPILDSSEKADFETLSSNAAKRNVDMWKELHASLAKAQKPGTKPKRPKEYVRKYLNNLINWYLEVCLETDALRIVFQGDLEHRHAFRHYRDDVVTWLLTHDENAAVGRYPSTSPGPWLLN
ncbi:hypothetical protein IFR05_015292, partial [Cadophora sp. M221]